MRVSRGLWLVVETAGQRGWCWSSPIPQSPVSRDQQAGDPAQPYEYIIPYQSVSQFASLSVSQCVSHLLCLSVSPSASLVIRKEWYHVIYLVSMSWYLLMFFIGSGQNAFNGNPLHRADIYIQLAISSSLTLFSYQNNAVISSLCKSFSSERP